MHALNSTSLLTDEYALLSKFFDYTPDLLCIASYEGYFLKINPSVCRVLGYTEEELLKMKISDLVVDEDKKATYETRKEMLKGKPLLNFENRYLTKSGEEVWLSWTSMPIIENQYVFAIAKEVTHRKKMERHQELLFDQISQINKELEHFARMASHNLRSPIANIIGLFELIDYNKIYNEDNLNVINMIRKSTQKVSETLESYINELIKKETNAKLQIQTLDISACFNEVCNSIGAIINKHHVSIETDFSGFTELEFNKSYLESIFLNLITNSIKYRNKKLKPHIVVKSFLTADGGKQLTISDNGLGFDLEKVKDRIFGLNQTFHKNSDSKGLGLFLVKKHITELGGDIKVYSEKNKGATFTITFNP
ncbi:MAG TPA: PAS domain-containing sensor histidine kinase [Pelobium sp.]|nr:PAS domain-containing sensor histidine kinase [Pelobium sp.]